MFFFGLFNKKNKNEHADDVECLIQKVSESLFKLKEDIKKFEQKIYDIDKAVNKMISDIFYVPSAFLYEELKNYEKIKNLPENENADNNIVSETERLIEEYLSQKEVFLSKVEFSKLLLKKYEKMIERLELLRGRKEKDKNKKSKIAFLKEYSDKLKKISNDNEADLIYESEKSKQIIFEIEEIEEDFKIKKEVGEYIENLTGRYIEDNKGNYAVLTDEIKKLTKNL